MSSVLAHLSSLSTVAAWAALSLVIGMALGGMPDTGGADAGGGDGAPAGGDAGDGHSSDQGDRPLDEGGGDDVRHAGGSEADEDLDDEDADLPEEIRNDPKRLRTRFRRTQRQLGAVRPIAERFRGADGRFMPPQEIDRLIGRAQDMTELEQFFAEHPDIVQQIVERRRGGARTADNAVDEDQFQDPFADLSKLTWDVDSPSGKQFLELFRDGAKQNHELRQMVKRLERQVGQVNERDTTRTIAQIEQGWKSATLKAAEQVPEVSRTTFVNAVYRAFELARAKGNLGKVSVQKLLERELEPYTRANRGRQRQTVAGQQRRAEHNHTIPRPGRGQTTAATARDTNKVGTIRDGRKSFFERVGMSTPPR